jgi:hypothetical protein
MAKARKAARDKSPRKKVRQRNPEMMATLEDLREMARRVRMHEADDRFLPVLATLLRSLSVYSRRGGCPGWLAQEAWLFNDHLTKLSNAWHSGYAPKVERWVGLSHPPHWRRRSAQLRSDYRWLAYVTVANSINAGAKTPDVFRTVAESGDFPVRESKIRDWYYELEKSFGLTERRSTFHATPRKRGKTGRT